MSEPVVKWTPEAVDAAHSNREGYSAPNCTFCRGHLNAAAAVQFAPADEQEELRHTLEVLAEMEAEKERQNPNLGNEARYLRDMLARGVVVMRGPA